MARAPRQKAVEQAESLARRIWLAGLGAYGQSLEDAQQHLDRAGGEASRLFQDLVEKGQRIEEQSRSGIRKSMAYLGAAMAEIMASARDSWNMQEFLGMFKNVGRALASMITEAILKALDALPGLDLTDDVQREAANARNNWNTAKNRLEDFNGAEAVQGAIDAIRRANQKGEAAASKAGNGNVIDPTTAANSYKAIYDKLKARIDAQRSADEIFGEILADIDKKKASSDSPAAGTDKPEISRLDPIVTSLAKVGGGGYSTGLLDMQRENNRLTGETNQHLKDIKERVSKGYGGSQVASFA